MEVLRTDVLVVGSGAAGARAAYEAKRHFPGVKVTLVSAGRFGASGSTALVASESLGINAPLDLAHDGDSPDVYLQDMLDTGLGLADPTLCEVVAREAGDRIRELMELGVKFDGHPVPVPKKLSGCTKARSLTAGGATGRAMLSALKTAGVRLGVEVREGLRAIDLVRRGGGVCGAYFLPTRAGGPAAILAKATVLATGGAGRLFAVNVNPPGLEGDGWAMALRAGAKLTNLEFFQVGPGVVWPRIKFIIHSFIWRLGPKLKNVAGEEFLPRYCPPGVDPQEVVALKSMSYPFSVRTNAMYLDIAIFKEIVEGRGTRHRGVYLDFTHIPAERIERTAPITWATLFRAGADLAREPIEIAPVVQNFNGGVAIDAEAFTGVEGLWAAGEVSGGVHGADRPGGNNLTDTQVFGYRAGVAAARWAASRPAIDVRPDDLEIPSHLSARERRAVARLVDLYYRHLTIVRNEVGLRRVLDEIARVRKEFRESGMSLFLHNRLLVGEAIALSALVRRESRGTHYREDYPSRDPSFDRSFRVAMEGEDGSLVVL